MSSKKEIEEEKRPLSSIPLQTFLYFDELFSILYFVIEALIFVYKGYGLFYPPNTIGIEIFLLFAFAFNQFSRIFIGSMGNKTEVTSYILWFLILCLPSAFFFAFFIRLQTYVIVLEVVVNAFGIAFLGLEFLFSISAFLTFKHYEN